MSPILPPNPASRDGRFAFWRYLRAFRRDILSANPERLYRAKMAEFRLPFLHTFLTNEPALWRRGADRGPRGFPQIAAYGGGA